MKRSVAALWLVGMLAGCGVSPPPVTALDASRAHIELADLQHGRSLLVSKCGGCHRPPQPSDHRGDLWPEKLDEMSPRAHLDVLQRHLIEQYLVTMAAP
jgi:mono/diheme cytochrome c family protein